MTDKKKQPSKIASKVQPKNKGEPLAGLDIIAIELRRAREAKGLSHSELNRLTGISRTVLYGYEVGRTKPGAREIKLLSEALEVTPNRLILGTDEPFRRAMLRGKIKQKISPSTSKVTFGLFSQALMSALDNDQADAIMTLLISLVEGRDKELFKQLMVSMEVVAEHIEGESTSEMVDIVTKLNDPVFVEMLSKKCEDRIKSTN